MNEPLTPLPKPDWIRVRIGAGRACREMRALVEKHHLHTVCSEALCPNLGECWENGRATLMILGDRCSRNCRFCGVQGDAGGVYDQEEPERVKALQTNVDYFIKGLQERGFDTLNSETPIVPIIAGTDERAWLMAKLSQEQDIFVLPVVSPAVPVNTSRLRANVTAGHTLDEIEHAMNIFEEVGKQVGVLPG